MQSSVYLEEAVMMDHPILVVQQRKEGVLCVQQHLPLPLLLSLPSRVHSLLQRQDLPFTAQENRANIRGQPAQDQTVETALTIFVEDYLQS